MKSKINSSSVFMIIIEISLSILLYCCYLNLPNISLNNYSYFKNTQCRNFTGDLHDRELVSDSAEAHESRALQNLGSELKNLRQEN